MNNEQRLDRAEDQIINLRLTASSLLEIVTLHQQNMEQFQRNFDTAQRNFEQIFTEIGQMRADLLLMQAEFREVQTDVRGLQTENRRILDILQNRDADRGDS